jgi:PAS domain S-box-containing protein
MDCIKPGKSIDFQLKKGRWLLMTEFKSPKTSGVTSSGETEKSIQPQTPVDWLFLQPSILDQLHDSIIITDMNGTITGCNLAVSHMFGYTQQELVGHNVSIFYPEEELAIVRESVFQTVLERGQYIGEMRNKTKSGAEIYIHLSITILRDSDSNAVGMVGLSQDITERKLNELALRQSDQKLRGLAQVCPDFFFTTRPDGWTDWVSPKFYEHTGAAQGSGDGLLWTDYLHPEDRDKTGEKWMNSVKRGDPFETEHRFAGRDGQYRWFRSRAIPIRNAKGEIERWVGIGSDIHNQKQTEAALRESERKFQNLAEAIPHAVWITSEDGFAEYSNQRWLDLTDQTMEQSLGRGWLTVIHPDDVQRTMAQWEKAAALKQPFESEYRVRTGNGGYRWHLARGVLHESTEGSRGDQWFGTCTDIHDHKMAMEALRDREATLRNFYEHSPFSMGITELLDDDVRIVYGNPASCRAYGLTPGATAGQTVRGLGASPEGVRSLVRSYVKCFETGKPMVSEYLRKMDGKEHWFRETIAPLDIAPSGNPRFTFVTEDITEQKLAEAALRQQQGTLEALIESTTSYIFMKNREGRYVFINSAGAKAVEKTVAEIVGRDDTFLFPPVHARQIREKDRELMDAGHSEVYEEIQPLGGELRHLLSSKGVCRDSAGAVIGIVGITRDITDIKHATDAFISNELNSAGARMAHALAHEINNPLAAITNALYLLQQGTPAFPPEALLTSAEDALARITKITRQMIGLYHRNAPVRRLKVQDVVEDTVASMDSIIRGKGIQIEKRLGNAEFSGIETDVRQLVAALMNNAVEQSRGVIKMRLYSRASVTGKPGLSFQLLIADNGPGIAREHRNQLFEPFFSTKQERGSGLGLWVVKGIVEKYGGSIRLRSSTREGASGTCVWISLPSHASSRAMPGGTTIKN